MDDPHPAVIAWLRRAHAGELGAALAYRGHALSLRLPAEREHVWAILCEEIQHRREAAALLARLGGRPDRCLVRRIARLGRMAGIACHCTGHLLPMLGAALAEAINVWEYQEMARVAQHDPAIRAFAQRAAATERDHAEWFLRCCRRHHGFIARLIKWALRRSIKKRGANQPCFKTNKAVLVTGSI